MQSSFVMWVWAASFLCFLQGVKLLFPRGLELGAFFAIQRQKLLLQRVITCLQELEELLAAGMVPEAKHWDALRLLPSPWNGLSVEAIQELRKNGAPVLPTLKRLRSLAVHQRGSLEEARSRSAQALAQAWVCAFLVPCFGGALYLLLPGIPRRIGLWTAGCGLALLCAAFGAIWIAKIAEVARWGGLRPEERRWLFLAQCAGERFLGWVRSGAPPDLAWGKACDRLAGECPALALEWGFSAWREEPAKSAPGRYSAPARPIVELGQQIRKAIQVSLFEGRPCTERTEAALFAFQQEMNAQVSRSLLLISHQALKPLFLCIAPALMGLLALGLWITWLETV